MVVEFLRNHAACKIFLHVIKKTLAFFVRTELACARFRDLRARRCFFFGKSGPYFYGRSVPPIIRFADAMAGPAMGLWPFIKSLAYPAAVHFF
jgi:hypothetical protein